MNTGIKSTLTLLLLALTLFGGTLGAATPGQRTFEKAYRTEAEDPALAIALYRRAIKLGLKRELIRAARWKLFYLYQKQKDYVPAILLTNYLGSHRKLKRVVIRLCADARFFWKVNPRAFGFFLGGMRSLHKTSFRNLSRAGIKPLSVSTKELSEEQKRKPLFMHNFEKALEAAPGNSNFRKLIISALLKKNMNAHAANLVEVRYLTQLEKDLLQGDRLVRTGANDQAHEILMNIAAGQENLTPAQKNKVLYLLGRIARAKGNIPGAVSYFRLAANYGTDAQVRRQTALAAFTLYKSGYPLQARALTRGLPNFKSFQIRLFVLVLRAQVDRDPAAFALLRKRRKYLLKVKATGKYNFINEKALQLLKKKRRKRK